MSPYPSSPPPSYRTHTDAHSSASSDNAFSYSSETVETMACRTPSDPPATLAGAIHVETSFTLEEQFTEPSQAQAEAVVFGDHSNFYQATVSATSHFTRNIFSTTSLLAPGEHAEAGHSSLPRNRTWIVTALLLALINLMATAVDSMMGVMIPTILYDLDIQGFQWTLAAPAVGAAATVLAAAQLYAAFPFKQVYVLFGALLLIGTISPGFAPNMAFLFAARVLMGVGFAGQQVGVLVFLDHDGTFTDKWRRNFFVSVSSSLGLILGAFFGAAWAHRNKFWVWGFYCAFCVLILVFAVTVYFIPAKLDITTTGPWTYGEALTWSSRIARLDSVGCCLSFLGLMAILVSFNLAGTLVPWSNPFIYIPMGLGVLAIVLLGLQQAFQIVTSPPTRLFPLEYFRHVKTTAIFLVIFFMSGIFSTIAPYTAFYQLATRPDPSAIGTALYLFLTFSGPHLLPILVVPVYIGGGMVTKYPFVPSFSVWNVCTSLFILTATALLFTNTPSFFPESGGLPTVAKEFALASIGFWTAVVMPLMHQIMDTLQASPTSAIRQKHPYHNRAFVLFATYLGAAVALTTTGAVFMHLAPQVLIPLLRSYPIPHVEATKKDALYQLLGYTFIRDGVSQTLFDRSIEAVQDLFGWSYLVELVLAGALSLASIALLLHKIFNGELSVRQRVKGTIPREWREDQANCGPEEGPESIELSVRNSTRNSTQGITSSTTTTTVEGPLGAIF